MRNRTLLATIGCALLVAIPIAMAEGVSLEGVKCLFAAKNDAKEASSAEWKDGKVYFCCDGCKGKFDKLTQDEKDKMAAKANAQLVASKQYEQKACPLSGGDLNKEATVEIGGVKVAFCCNSCKGKAEDWKDDDKLENVFGEKAFKKAKFTKVEVKE